MAHSEPTGNFDRTPKAESMSMANDDERGVVLFVDDEVTLCHALSRALRKEPYEVLTAQSAAEALTTLRSRRVDVVVSDERMPEVSGSELLSQIRGEFPDVVRLMLTGEASLDAVVGAINDGLYRFLSKPMGTAELAAHLRQALHMKRLKEQSARTRPTVATPAAPLVPIVLTRSGAR
jgi:DNA-binding NtrC family response regulator